MKKIHCLFLVLACLLAGAVLVSGCKQPEQGGQGGQGSGQGSGAGGSGQGSGSGQGQGQGQGSGTTTQTGTIAAARNFEGVLVGKDENDESKKIRYRVTVSLSDGKVGASAELVGEGHFYIGKAPYDASEGEVSVSLADVRGSREPINLAATYEKATDTLVVTEFAGNGEKQLLPREVHKNDLAMHRYNAMVSLPQVGDAYISLLYNKTHATAIISTGSAAEHGELGSTRAYYGEGYVHRDTLQAKVLLQKTTEGTRTFLITAKLDTQGRIIGNNITVQLIEEKKEYDVYENGYPDFKEVPLFHDAHFTLNYRDFNDIHDNGNQPNLKAKLILRAEPLLRHPKEPHKVVTATEKQYNLRGYRPYGYRMTAQFIGFTTDGKTDAIKSSEARIDVSYEDTDTTKAGYYNPVTRDYTFNFGTKNAAGESPFYNGASYKDVFPITISNWRPVKTTASGVVYPENVESGEYLITIGTAATVGKVPTVSSVGEDFTSLFGSVRVRRTDNVEHYPKLGEGAKDGDYCFGTMQTIGAGNRWQARHLFDHVDEQEGFKKKAERR